MAVTTTYNTLILHYNNYFNRVIKSLETVAEYRTADSTIAGSTVLPHYKDCININFNPGDGILTSLVLGYGSNPADMKNDYDYLIYYSQTIDTEQNTTEETIISRWFVLENNRTRDGQYEFALRRDVIADNLDTVLDSTAYIEKGYLAPNDPLIFNKESLEVNQIKDSEILLKDRSDVPWLVAYIAKSSSLPDTTINYSPSNQNFIEVSAATIDTWEYSGYTALNPFLGSLYNISYKTYWQSGEWWIYNYAGISTITGTGGSAYNKGDGSHNYALRTSWHSGGSDMSNKLLKAYQYYGLSTFNNALTNLMGAHTVTEVNALKYYNNKVIKTQDGKYYSVKIQQIDNKVVENAFLNNSTTSLWALMSNAVSTSGAFTSGYTTPDNGSFSCSYTAAQYIVTCIEQTNYNVTSKISATRTKTNDALYDIIALPYGEINIHNSNSSVSINTNKIISMSAMTSLALALGGGGATSAIYDIQLLPYCPIQSILDGNGLLIDTTKETVDFDYIKDNSDNTKIGAIFYIPNSSFTFDIDQELTWDKYQYISDFTDVDLLPLPYSSLHSGVDYVIPTLVKPDDVPSGSQVSIRTLESGNIVNGITVRKINRATGIVMDSVDVASIVITFASGGNTILTANIYVPSVSGYWTPWLIYKNNYENSDYYIGYTLNAGAWGAQNIDYLVEVSKIPVYDNKFNESVAVKIDNDCNAYRLVSPTYQGEFEFSVVKNGGVERFNVDCTYKPYNPYIHINPNFKLMYGADFNDSRGLICQGDYTVGMISDAFTQYELQNKNYQSIFNRQIQNMDVMNDIAKQEAAWGMAGGVLKGTASGAITGAMVGGGYGAIAGAVVGAAASTVGGIMDLVNLDKKIEENRSYAIDMYNYSLQNIKALPYSMTRCTALTFNNKLFPFIEKYTCTDQEREAYVYKLKYDGMTVNRIGKVQNFTDLSGRMVRGEIIRLDESTAHPFKDDAHMASEIYNEIKKGVYL